MLVRDVSFFGVTFFKQKTHFRGSFLAKLQVEINLGVSFWKKLTPQGIDFRGVVFAKSLSCKV